jgi:hypothetical protein
MQALVCFWVAILVLIRNSLGREDVLTYAIADVLLIPAQLSSGLPGLSRTFGAENKIGRSLMSDMSSLRPGARRVPWSPIMLSISASIPEAAIAPPFQVIGLMIG